MFVPTLMAAFHCLYMQLRRKAFPYSLFSFLAIVTTRTETLVHELRFQALIDPDWILKLSLFFRILKGLVWSYILCVTGSLCTFVYVGVGRRSILYALSYGYKDKAVGWSNQRAFYMVPSAAAAPFLYWKPSPLLGDIYCSFYTNSAHCLFPHSVLSYCAVGENKLSPRWAHTFAFLLCQNIQVSPTHSRRHLQIMLHFQCNVSRWHTSMYGHSCGSIL